MVHWHACRHSEGACCEQLVAKAASRLIWRHVVCPLLHLLESICDGTKVAYQLGQSLSLLACSTADGVSAGLSVYGTAVVACCTSLKLVMQDAR